MNAREAHDQAVEKLAGEYAAKGFRVQREVGDFLAAAEHVERWRERSARHAATLAQIAQRETWESRPGRTFGVARAIYCMLPDDARLWRAGQDFIVIERPRIVAALAA